MLNAELLFNQIGFHRYFYALFTLQSFSHFGRVPSWAWPVCRWRRKKGSCRPPAAAFLFIALFPHWLTQISQNTACFIRIICAAGRRAGEIVCSTVSGFECTPARQKLQKNVERNKATVTAWRLRLKYKLIILESSGNKSIPYVGVVVWNYKIFLQQIEFINCKAVEVLFYVVLHRGPHLKVSITRLSISNN